MNLSRQEVLGGLFVFVTVVAAALLADVLATVFFSFTIAYRLFPARRQLTNRGLSPRTASLVTTLAAFFGTLALAAPFVAILLLRLDDLLVVLESIPAEMLVEIAGLTYTLTLEELSTVLVRFARTLATASATAAPVLLIKFTLFGLLVFSLLLHQQDARRATLALVPSEYRGVAEALNRRTRETLFAIYVLQAAVAVGTFLVALPVFSLFGYDYPLTLAAVSAFLQFVPIVGPSLVLAALAGWHVVSGQLVQAALVFFVGGFLVAWLPDILIRPRLARETADLPGSLYFVGFVGGVLSLGPVGFIAGPLAVALVVELANLLAAELNGEATESPKTTD